MRILGRIRMEDIAVVLLLLFFGVSGSIPGIAPNQASEMTGAAATRLQIVVGLGTQAVVNGTIAFLLLRWSRLVLRHPAVLAAPCILAAWAVVSTLWSQDPLLTLRRSLPFALAAALGVLLALRFTPQRLLLLLQVTFLVLACGTAIVALGFPAIGLDASTGHGGDWQGVFTQKNACGRAMVFAVAAALCSARYSVFSVAAVLVFGAELLLSGSRGAWLLGAVLAACLLLFRASCRLTQKARTALLAFSALGSAGVAAVAVLRFATLAALLHRDPTLTGRTAIWHQVWISILHRPLLGYGFAAFWRGAQGASWDIVVALKFVLFHAHNGFLEIWLELGAVGLLLFAGGFVRAAWLLWPELQAGRFDTAAWPFAMLLLVALYDLDENTLVSFNGIFWVLYTAALAQIELLAAGRKQAPRRSPACARRSWAWSPQRDMSPAAQGTPWL